MMTHCFVKPTVWKSTTNAGKPVLLGLVCCFVMVAGLLTTRDIQAFSKGDRVVLQNAPNGRYVRKNPIVDPEEEPSLVHNGTEGTLLKDPVKDPTYTWYKVDWDTANGEELEDGWTADVIDGCPFYIDLAERADQRDVIVERLFNGIPPEKMDQLDNPITHEDTNHDYNGYGCNLNWKVNGKLVYQGGHAGWDAQTLSVVGPTPKGRSLVDEPFYSLTAGTVVIANPGKTKGNTAVIAIYDKLCDKTTLYLHAREIDPYIIDKFGKDIDQDTLLGIQGNTGLWKFATEEEKKEYEDNPESFSEHVHIEVIDGDIREMGGKFDGGAAGAGQTIDPIPYLYRWASGAQKADFLPSDVNHDGKVDYWDWLLVLASSLRNLIASYDPKCDVNNDGTVDKADRDEVRKNFNESPPGAPRTSRRNPIDRITVRTGQFSINGKVIPREMVQQLLDITRRESDGSLTFKQGIAMLESLLAAIIPEKTALLANYPNPFNPETWIPYYLANDADVTITIHDITGALVRRLEVGHQKAGYYTSQNRAVYWDGRTEVGEHVASGIYFYRLTTSNYYTHTRKMVILK